MKIRYYAYGHLGYLYDTYKFNACETYNPDDMFQLKNSPIWSKLKAVQNNKAIYYRLFNLYAWIWHCVARNNYETNS